MFIEEFENDKDMLSSIESFYNETIKSKERASIDKFNYLTFNEDILERLARLSQGLLKSQANKKERILNLSL